MAAKLTAVLGMYKRRGRWKIAGKTKAFVFLGNCYVDCRDAYVDPDQEKITLSVLCVLGSVTFIVPEGSDIQPSVVSLLASTAFDVPEVDAESPLPPLVVDSTTLLGRCRVLTTAPDGADDERDVVNSRPLVDAGKPSGPTRVDSIGSSRT